MEVLYWQKQRRRTHLLSYHVCLKRLPYIQNVLGSSPRGTNGASCGSLCRLQRLTLWSSHRGTNEGQFYSRAHVKVEHTQTEPEPSVHYTCIIKKKKKKSPGILLSYTTTPPAQSNLSPTSACRNPAVSQTKLPCCCCKKKYIELGVSIGRGAYGNDIINMHRALCFRYDI